MSKYKYPLIVPLLIFSLILTSVRAYADDRDSIRQAFGAADAGEAEDVMFLPKIMSRKKQVIPMLSALWG